MGLVINTSYTAFTALVPSVILGFYWPRASTQGARWSIGIGLVVALITIGWWENPFGLDIYSGFWTLMISTLVLVVVSLFTRPPSREVLEYFELTSKSHP